MATIIGSAFASHRKFFHICLWTAQIMLAMIFVASGSVKLGLPSERLVEGMAWAEALPVAVMRLLGVGELLGAFALVVPTAMHQHQRVAGAAAVGFFLFSALIAAANLARGDLRVLPINLSLVALSAFVAWGRGVRLPDSTKLGSSSS